MVALFRADQAIFVTPVDTDFELRTSGIERADAEALGGMLVGTGPGRNAYADAKLDRYLTTLATKRVEVWNIPLADRLSGIQLKRTRFFQEVVAPSSAFHQTVMGVPLAEGLAMAGVGHASPEIDLSYKRGLGLMRMLLPSFKAGVHMQDRLNRRRSDLSRCLDALEEPLMVRDLDGRDVHRNLALEKLLEDEPDSAVVLSAMGALGMDLARRRHSRRKSSREVPLADGNREIRTARGIYTLRGCYLASGVFAREAVVLLTVSSCPPQLPSSASLMERFDLTPREAEVALILAEGRSNREIAKILSISPHTVRHHAEHIFLKLDVTTRKALALRLLGRGRSRL